MNKPRFLTVTSTLVIIGAISLCSACENMGNFNSGERAYAAATDPIALRIAEAADKAAAALSDLSRVEQAKHPAAPVPNSAGLPAELAMPVDVSWIGNAEPILRDLGARMNYRVTSFNAQPKTPVIVRLEYKERPMVDVLRDIGEQATEVMDLVVDPPSRRLEIHYKIAKTDGPGKAR